MTDIKLNLSKLVCEWQLSLNPYTKNLAVTQACLHYHFTQIFESNLALSRANKMFIKRHHNNKKKKEIGSKLNLKQFIF